MKPLNDYILERGLFTKDNYKDIIGYSASCIQMGNHMIEFKEDDETNSDGSVYFDQEEAKRLFDKPDKEGWRLPTKAEADELLRCKYKNSSSCIEFFCKGQSLILYKQGMNTNRGVRWREDGYYWTSTPSRYVVMPSNKKPGIGFGSVLLGMCVRLVRTVK